MTVIDEPAWMIDGFAVAGYRSFGSDAQRFGPLGKINLLAGQNNSGKSNALRFVHERLGSLLGGSSGGAGGAEAKGLDAHRPDEPPLRFAIATRVDGPASRAIGEALGEDRRVGEAFEGMMSSHADESGLVWWPFSTQGVRNSRAAVEYNEFAKQVTDDATRWSRLGMAVSSLAAGNSRESYVR